jgi:antitoxin ParD1/3/4
MLHRTITSEANSVAVLEEGNLMKMITLYLPEPYIEALNQLVNEKFYPNRAEAIRVAIRDLISDEVWRRKVVG